MATSAAIAPLPAMPMSIFFVLKYAVKMPERTPAQAASWVTRSTSVKRPSVALSVEPGLKPNQPSHRMKMPSPKSGMLWPGDGARLAVRPVLAPARAEQEQRGKGAGRSDQVDRGRAGEVLHAGCRVWRPAAAEPPSRETSG